MKQLRIVSVVDTRGFESKREDVGRKSDEGEEVESDKGQLNPIQLC